MARSESVYGNIQKASTVRKAEKSKQKYIKKFGDDTNANYSAEVVGNDYIGDILGVKNIEIGKSEYTVVPVASDKNIRLWCDLSDPGDAKTRNTVPSVTV